MRKSSTYIFKATIKLGLQKHYSKSLYTKKDVVKVIQLYQKKQLQDKGFGLSVSEKKVQLFLLIRSNPIWNCR